MFITETGRQVTERLRLQAAEDEKRCNAKRAAHRKELLLQGPSPKSYRKKEGGRQAMPPTNAVLAAMNGAKTAQIRKASHR